MQETLRALSGLLLEAIPTLIIVLLLHFYLKKVYFRPMEKVLAARFDATEGARKLAEESLEKASAMAAEYDAALRSARNELYKEQEEFRQALRQEHEQAVKDARERASQMVKEADGRLEAELEASKRALKKDAGALSERIVETILSRRPA
jgi:F-type H+-transporting ATPase subunit b